MKKLRLLENTSLLLLSKDNALIEDAKKIFDCVKQLSISSCEDESIQLCSQVKYDVIVVDNNEDSFLYIFDKLNKINMPDIKIIIIDMENDKYLYESINSGAYNVFVKPLNLSNLKLSIIVSLNQTKRSDKINLGNGFYFDGYRDRVYTRTGTAINLTKLELGLLKLVIDNKGTVVDYDSIAKNVWKGKNMSIFTMRNVVNKIRTKIYYDVFNNASSKGYIIH